MFVLDDSIEFFVFDKDIVKSKIDRMKQRIFITIHYLEIGGVERSLLGLLNALDTDLYDIDLFVYSHQGEFMRMIPEKIRLLPEISQYAALERPVKEIIKNGYWSIAFARLMAKWACRRYMKRSGQTEGSAIFQYVADYTTGLLPPLYRYGEYDLAISFLTPHNIVLEKVQAKKKIAWIHTDYSAIQIDKERELKVWERYDYIASISENVTQTFLQVFPEVKEKIILIENILSSAFVREQAILLDVSNEMKTSEGEVRLCSVGRFSSAKNFDNVPFICKSIVERGVRVKWFLIGFGGDEQLIRDRIAEAQMEEYVFLLGKKENPYPYMKTCDVYIQPSRYEGKAVTVREAQMLCKPVVITNFPTAYSQLTDGVDGVIVPFENEACAEGIVKVIKNHELRQSLIAYLQAHDYGNEAEVEKIYQLK